MAITDYKITDGEITQRNVKSAPDVLSDTPNNNKAVFDNLTEHFIGKYNDLIDNINSDFVDSSEFAEGLTVTDKVRWRYALTKGTSIGLNFSGNITQITTGFRTIVGDIDNLTETDFMDCYLSINGEDYECGDSYASGNSILTSAVINGVTVEIIYDTASGNITLEHATNPLDTLYWNVSIYRSVAEKVPRKALPASVSNDGYTELNDKYTELNDLIEELQSRVIVIEKEETYSAQDSHTININSSELQELGVDDLDNYSVISFRWRFGINNAWRDTGVKSQNDSPSIFPIVTSSTDEPFIRIQPYNSSSSSAVFRCRLVLLKVK